MVFARMHDIVVIWNFHEWKPYSLCADGADGSGSGFIKKGNKACHAALFGTVFSGRRSSGGVDRRKQYSAACSNISSFQYLPGQDFICQRCGIADSPASFWSGVLWISFYAAGDSDRSIFCCKCAQ